MAKQFSAMWPSGWLNTLIWVFNSGRPFGIFAMVAANAETLKHGQRADKARDANLRVSREAAAKAATLPKGANQHTQICVPTQAAAAHVENPMLIAAAT